MEEPGGLHSMGLQELDTRQQLNQPPTLVPSPCTVQHNFLSQQMYQLPIALVYVSEPDSPRSLTFWSLCFNKDRFTTENISK